LTDTGRRWDGSDVSVRDKVGIRQRDRETKGRRDLGTMKDDCRLTNLQTMSYERRTMNERLGLRFRGTQDIIDAAEAGLLPDKIMMTVHPQRWSACPVK